MLTPRAAPWNWAPVPMVVACLMAHPLWAAAFPYLPLLLLYQRFRGLPFKINYLQSSLLRVCSLENQPNRTVSSCFDWVTDEVVSFHQVLSYMDKIPLHLNVLDFILKWFYESHGSQGYKKGHPVHLWSLLWLLPPYPVPLLTSNHSISFLVVLPELLYGNM